MVQKGGEAFRRKPVGPAPPGLRQVGHVVAVERLWVAVCLKEEGRVLAPAAHLLRHAGERDRQEFADPLGQLRVGSGHHLQLPGEAALLPGGHAERPAIVGTRVLEMNDAAPDDPHPPGRVVEAHEGVAAWRAARQRPWTGLPLEQARLDTGKPLGPAQRRAFARLDLAEPDGTLVELLDLPDAAVPEQPLAAAGHVLQVAHERHPSTRSAMIGACGWSPASRSTRM